MIVKDNPDTLTIDIPYLLVLMHITVQSEHVEEDVDGEDRVARGVEETGFLLLLLNLVAFEELRLHVDEVERLFVLSLFRQHFKVQTNEFLVDLEIWLLHKLE